MQTTALQVQLEAEGKTYGTSANSRWKQKQREKKGRRLTQEVSRKEREKPSILFILTCNEISEVSILPVQIIKI